MLATMKSRLDASTFDDLKLMKAFPVLISRALVGASAACILFFFLLSGGRPASGRRRAPRAEIAMPDHLRPCRCIRTESRGLASLGPYAQDAFRQRRDTPLGKVGGRLEARRASIV
jgi:hypothetical protein